VVCQRYYDRFAAENCMRYINGTTLDERIVRTDWDPGFSGDRQFGRGRSGGQVRDEYRSEYDSGRGGYGRQYQRQTPTAYTEFQSAPSISGKKNLLFEERSEEETKRRQQNLDRIRHLGTKRSLDDPSSSQASKNPRFREREDNDD
jgi:nuclear cap-binding protein subunit 2